MTNDRFDAWCRQAAGQIRCKPDRTAVYQELLAHLEDHRDACMAEGLTEEAATQKALEAMGSAEEIAPQLAKLHKPFWGYFYSTVKVLAILLCVFAVFSPLVSACSTVNYFIHYSDDPDHMSPNLLEDWQLVTQVKPKDSAFSDGCIFLLPDAVLWEMDGEYVLAASMQNIDLRQTGCNFGRYSKFWAVDSDGNYYPSRDESLPGAARRVTNGGGMETGALTGTTVLIVGVPTADVQWLELHYDRDGRDIVLRIDLSGGAGT